MKLPTRGAVALNTVEEPFRSYFATIWDGDTRDQAIRILEGAELKALMDEYRRSVERERKRAVCVVCGELILYGVDVVIVSAFGGDRRHASCANVRR